MDYADMSDDDLIRRFRAGDQKAFWELHRRYDKSWRQWLSHIDRKLIWSHLTEFENRFQRVLEGTAGRTYPLGGAKEYGSFLKKAFHYRVIDWFRARDRRPGIERPDLNTLPAREGTAAGPLRRAQREESVKAFLACSEELPEKQRRVIDRVLRGHTLAQIARDIGIQTDTCRKRHERAIDRLRKCLARKGFPIQE